MSDDTQPTDEQIERAGDEQGAWDWLDQMVSGICGEHPCDIAYSADQMVDAYLAGASAAEAREAEQAATIASLRAELAEARRKGMMEAAGIARRAADEADEKLRKARGDASLRNYAAAHVASNSIATAIETAAGADHDR